MGQVIKRIQKGKICLKVWENENKMDSTYTITCKYKKRDTDDWVETKTFFKNDLINMKEAIEDCLGGNG